MLLNRLTAVTLSLAAVALGISACDSADDGAAAATDQATTADAATTATPDAGDTQDTGDTAQSGGAPSDDYCTVAIAAFADFDPGSIGTGDPGTLTATAQDFRAVAEAAEGEIRDAWNQGADFLDSAAAAGNDPAAAATLMDQMTTMDTWTATINESLFNCA